MKQYLCEGIEGAVPFVIDRSVKPVIESLPSGGAIHRYPGRLSICDCVNGNNRRYRRAVWEKNLIEGSPLKKFIAGNAAFGLLEHPADGKLDLRSPISHQVTKAQLRESKDPAGKSIWEVVGEISLYNPNLNQDSAKLLSLIEGGYNPMVSSRGYGSLTTGTDGVDDVQDDYVCEGFDVVIKPSFEQAKVQAQKIADDGDAVRTESKKTAGKTILGETTQNKGEKYEQKESQNQKVPQEKGAQREKEVNGVNLYQVYNRLAEQQFQKKFIGLTEEEAEQIVADAAGLSEEELRGHAIMANQDAELEEDHTGNGDDPIRKPPGSRGGMTSHGGSSHSKSSEGSSNDGFKCRHCGGHIKAAEKYPAKCPKCHRLSSPPGHGELVSDSVSEAEGNEVRWPRYTFACRHCGERVTSTAHGIKEGHTNFPTKCPKCGRGMGVPDEGKPPQQETQTMNINEIKSRIAALKQIDPGKLTPQTFAESVAEVENLHRDVANFVAEDVKRTYDGSRMDRDLDKITEDWNQIVAEPARKATKLHENNGKLLKVIAATAKAGINYKRRLGEALGKLNKSRKLNEELTRRGQGWRALAESRKDKLAEMSEHFDTATDTLDLVAARYHNDTTELARHGFMAEFKDKVTPEISKKIQEATRLRHIAAIREELEGKKPAEKKNAIRESQKPSAIVLAATGRKAVAEADDKAVDGKPIGAGAVQDDKKGGTPAKPIVTEAKVTLAGNPRDPRDINESVEMVRRLSGRPAPAKQ